MKIVITGGAGFIGSHLSEALLTRGDEVVVIDNFATARRDSLPARTGLRIVEGTIADRALVTDVVTDVRPDVVVHAAASYKDPDNWYEDSVTNVVGTANVVQAAKSVGIRRLVYFQTALCYGVRPLEQPITLAHPLRPEESSYAISKTAGEYYVRLSGLDFISFRLANVYGPRNLSGPLPTFFQRLTAGKACFAVDTRRDFIYVEDLVEIASLAVDGKGRSGVYHVSSGRDVSIKELFDTTVKAMGISAEAELRPRNPDDAPTILLDPSATIRDFGWRARVPLETGVQRAVEWYRANGVDQTFTHLRAGQPEHAGRR